MNISNTSNGSKKKNKLGYLKMFVGREAKIEYFQSNLRKDSKKWRNLFNIWGQGGVGKSSLINQLKRIAKEENAVTVHIPQPEQDAIQVMAYCAEELEKQGKILKQFSERYKVYLQRKGEIENDPDAPHGLLTFLGKTITKSMGVVNSLGGMEVVSQIFDEELGATRLISYLAKRLGKNDDVILFRNPIGYLTKLFLRDLNKIAKNSNLVFFFDSYEHSTALLDTWLREITYDPDGHLGITLPDELILVLSGRDALNGIAWRDLKELIVDWHLKPFTLEEIKSYLIKVDIDSPDVAYRIMCDSKGIPLWVEILALCYRDNDPENFLSHDALDYFLKPIYDEELRRIALEASLALELNLDILTIINSGKHSDHLFTWLISRSFLERASNNTYVYHAIIRNEMLSRQRHLSPRRWIEIHNSLASYYYEICESLLIQTNDKHQDPTWQENYLRALYHDLCGNPSQAIPKAICFFLFTLDRQLLSSCAERCAGVISAAGKASANDKIEHLGDCLLRGLLAFKDKDHDEGIKMLSFLLTQPLLTDESRAIALGWRGEAHRLAGVYDKSLKDFDAAIAVKDDDLWLIVSRSSTLRKMGRFVDSIQDCNKAIEINPTDIKALTSRGETYLRMKRHEDALKDFNRAVNLDDKDTWSLTSRGKVYQKMRRYKEAILDYNRAVSISPSDSWALSNRGFIYQKLGLYNKSLENYSRAILVNPGNARFFASRAETYRLMKHYDCALQDFSRALSLMPNDDWALARRAEVYLSLRKYDESLTDFEMVISLTPRNDWRLYTFSLALRASERYAEASAQISSAIRIANERLELNSRDYYRTALTLALYYISADKIDEANRIYDSVLSINIQPELIIEAQKSLDYLIDAFPCHKGGLSGKEKLANKLQQLSSHS